MKNPQTCRTILQKIILIKHVSGRKPFQRNLTQISKSRAEKHVQIKIISRLSGCCPQPSMKIYGLCPDCSLLTSLNIQCFEI